MAQYHFDTSRSILSYVNTRGYLNKTWKNSKFLLHRHLQVYNSNHTSQFQPGHCMCSTHPFSLFSKRAPCDSATCYKSPVVFFPYFSCVCHNVSKETNCDGNRIAYFQNYQREVSNVGKKSKTSTRT